MERFESGGSIQEAPCSIPQDLNQFGVDSTGSILLTLWDSSFCFSRFALLFFGVLVCYFDLGYILLMIEQASRVRNFEP